ncbi:hypothetical protein FDUTEX481_05363 [Tolypothrix sp. PCC 7601]|nr:hypothetical protein FDUTEX481_05363 [Tolypothrix sp. PCC 7601]
MCPTLDLTSKNVIATLHLIDLLGSIGKKWLARSGHMEVGSRGKIDKLNLP